MSIDIASGAGSDLQAGPGVKFNPSLLPGGVIAYIRKERRTTGIYYSNGARGPQRPDSRRVVVAGRHARRLSQAAHGAARDVEEDLEPQSGLRDDAHRDPAGVQRRQATASR